MSLLNRLNTAAYEKKTAWMFYGPCGIGKTSLAGQFKNVAFIPDGFDDGSNDLKANNLIPSTVKVFNPIRDYNDLVAVSRELGEEPGLEEHFEWVCFDNLSGIQEHIWQHRVTTVAKYSGSRDKFLEYGNGPEAAQQDVRAWTQQLDAICRRGIGVILLAHSTIKKDKNPLGESFDKIVPSIHEKTYEAIRQWCPNIGYIGQDISTEKEGMTHKAAALDIRTIRFSPLPAVDAKSRYNISTPVQMGANAQEGFKNLTAAVAASMKKQSA